MVALRGAAAVFLAVASLCLGCAGAGRAEPAQSRAALLIGNSDYPDGDTPLPTAVGDAQRVAEALKSRGFSVELVENGTRKAMDAAIAHFIDGIKQDSIVLVFFAGHGIQLEGKNYLIPVNARIWNDADVIRDGVSVDRLLADMGKHGAKADIVVLDASRRNPFERRFRSVSEGLAPAVAAPGILSLQSAAPGTLVNDDRGARTSVFGNALAKEIGSGATDAEEAFAAVREAVSSETQNQQNPALVSGLDDTFSFDGSRKAAAAPQTKVPPTPPPETAAAATPPTPMPAPAPVVPSTPAVAPPAPVIPPAPVAVAPVAQPAPVAVAVAAPPAPPPVPAPVPGPPPPAPEPAVAKPPPAPPPVPAPVAHQPAAQAASSPPPAPVAHQPAAQAASSAPPAPARPAPVVTAAAMPPPARPMAAAVARAPEPTVVKMAPSLPPAEENPKPVRTPYSEAELKEKSALDHRIVADAHDEEAFFERGQMLAEHGDYLLALADFDRSISLNPNNPDALNNRCWTRAMENQLETAMDDCNEALRLRANFSDAHDSRGLVLLKMGAARAAVLDYDAALKANPKHSSALYGRGIAELRLGKNSEAESDFSSALSLDADIERDYARYGLK